MYKIKEILYFDLEKVYGKDGFDLPKVHVPVFLKNKKPILVLGGSYAYGIHLQPNQKFYYKLSEILKEPVYSMAIPGSGFQHVYYQSQSELFYKKILEPDTIVWVVSNNDFATMLEKLFFIFIDVLFVHYSVKNDNLVLDDYNNPFVKFFKTSYSCRLIQAMLTTWKLQHDKYGEQISDEALLYFTKTRENLENHWHKKLNFIIFVYNPDFLYSLLIPKLEKAGFCVVTTKSLVNIDLETNPTYMHNDVWHPNEAAWDLLTPLFVQNLQKRKVL